MQPFFPYHGGKQYMATKLVDLIPDHKIYCEPFSGAASLLFAKPRKQVSNQEDYLEIINDNLNLIVIFYEQAKTNTEALFNLIDSRLYSEYWHSIGKKIIKNQDNYSLLEIAWAAYYLLNVSFGGGMRKGFAYGKVKKYPEAFYNKLLNFKVKCERLKLVTIHNRDALEIIKYYDTPQTFFYIDPPYINTHHSHYKEYSIENYIALINVLKDCKGKILLSGYKNEYVPDNWHYLTYDTICHLKKTINSSRDSRREYLWYNYELLGAHKFMTEKIENIQHPLFSLDNGNNS